MMNINKALDGHGAAQVDGCSCGVTVYTMMHETQEEPFMHVLFIPANHRLNQHDEALVAVANSEEELRKAMKRFAPDHLPDEGAMGNQLVEHLDLVLINGVVRSVEHDLGRSLTTDELLWLKGKMDEDPENDNIFDWPRQAMEKTREIYEHLGMLNKFEEPDEQDLRDMLSGLDLGDDQA